MKFKLKYLAPAALLGVSLLVWAGVRGPFHVASAGPNWAQYTYATDSGNEFEAAEKLFSLYVQSVVISAADRLAAVKRDYMRVVYYDGQIADFKISSFGNTLNLKFAKLQPAVDAPSPPSRLSKIIREGACGPGKSSFTTRTTYDTGYWGDVQGTRPNPDGGLPIVYITSNWISTGFVTITTRETCK